MCDWLQEVVLSRDPEGKKQTKGLLLVPRGSFKTTIGTVGLSIWLLARDSNTRVLISSHTLEKAQEFLSEIKERVATDQRLIDFIGDWRTGAKEWSENAIIIPQRTKALHSPSIDTSGVNKPKTGSHFDFVINDDLYSGQSSGNAVLSSVRRYVRNLYPIMDPGCVMLMIGTRWHGSDVYGEELDKDDRREVKGKPREWRTLIRSAYLDDGNLYFPARLSEEFLARRKEELIDDPKMYSFWYDNKVVSEGDYTFPRMWWKYFDGEVDPRPFPVLTTDTSSFPVRITAAIDPAYSTETRADFTGLTVVAVDNQKPYHLWVLEAERLKTRGGIVDVLDRIAYWLRVYAIRVVSTETLGNQSMFRLALVDRLREVGLGGVGVVPYKGGTGGRSKADRINALQPLFRQGRVHLRRGLSDLYRELEDWPETEHDDLLDSLSQHLGFAASPGGAYNNLLRDQERESEESESWGLTASQLSRKVEQQAGLSSQNFALKR